MKYIVYKCDECGKVVEEGMITTRNMIGCIEEVHFCSLTCHQKYHHNAVQQEYELDQELKAYRKEIEEVKHD